MKRFKALSLGMAAVAIFTFVAISSGVQAAPPGTAEHQREAAEWQTEAAEMANEAENSFEEFRREIYVRPPMDDDCDYSSGWCPPSCGSCSPPAF